MHRAIQDAGRWAYGTVLIEVWVLNDDRTQLIRPPGGFWLDPVFYSAVAIHEGGNDDENIALTVNIES